MSRVGTESAVGADKGLFGKDIDGLGEHEGVLIDDGDTEYKNIYLGLKMALLGTMLTALMALR